MAQAITLAKDGKTNYAIVVESDAIPAEKNAADRLKFYLHEVTGVDFPIVSETNVKVGVSRILIGPSKEVKSLIKDVKWATLRHDGIVIRTVGADLVLAGGRPRGTLYAVYTFLEDSVGCRWWSSDESTIPQKKTLTIDSLNLTYVPKLYYRDQMYRDIYKSREFLATLKINGHYIGLPESFGGNMPIIGWCHTFYQFLPPEEYFAKHPEWYSEINGKRTTHISQLCLTNEEMRKEMIRVVLEKFRENPTAEIISITQNDAPGGQCQCKKCRELEAREGSPSGPIIEFVNAIAAEVEKEFPNAKVETLAYQYSRVPPKNVKPRRNVVIRLCAGMGCCYDKPFESQYNAGFRDTTREWAKICPTLFAWDYVANFADTMVPHPNLRTLAPNIRFLVKNHTVGIFEEGDHWSTMGDFVRLRAWLLGHLMWRPDADEKQLIVEFMNGYYGAAGPYLTQYLDLVHDSFERANIRLTSSGSDVAYMTLEEMNKATQLFDLAEKAVSGDAKLLERVQRERVPLTTLWVMRYPDLKKRAAIKKQEFLGPKDPLAACDQMKAIAEKYNAEYRDGDPLSAYYVRLKARTQSVLKPATVPAECKSLREDQWLDVQNGRFFLQCGGQNVDDKQASDGNAAMMGGGHGDWSILCPVSSDWIRMYPGQWQVYAVVRCEVIRKTGLAFRMGIFDYSKFKDVVFQQINMEKAGDGLYHTYDLGVHKLNPNCGFWFAPGSNPEGVKGVYVDRIFIVPLSKNK
jgi:hypothetical protein